jgi:catechol 2,3-dioxygenase-like lactoylglutathione lyase family enzyme
MKVTGISWVGILTDDHVKTNDFWAKTLGLNQEWINYHKGIAFFLFPSGQEVEVYSSANRLRKEKYKYVKGPMLGIEVESIKQSCEEMAAQGFELIGEIESMEAGRVAWVYFLGPDGYLYSLHEHLDAHQAK